MYAATARTYIDSAVSKASFGANIMTPYTRQERCDIYSILNIVVNTCLFL